MPWYWPWNAQQTPSKPPQDVAEHTPDAESGTLQAQVSQLRSDLSSLQLEWAEVLDKIQRWGSRQAARERRRVHAQLDELVEDSPDGAEIAQEAAGATNGHQASPGSPADRLALKAALRARIRR